MISIYAAVQYLVQAPYTNTTDVLIGLLFLFLILMMLVGLVYPPAIVFWSDEKSRKRVLALSVWIFCFAFGLGSINDTPANGANALAGLFVILIPLALIFPWIVTPWSSRTSRLPAAGICLTLVIVFMFGGQILVQFAHVDPRYALTNEEFESTGPERRLMFLAASEVKGQTTSVKDISVSGGASDGYTVEVNLYEDSYDLPAVQNFALAEIMANAYNAIYTSGIDVREAEVSVYVPSQDGEDELIWKTAVAAPAYRQDNFSSPALLLFKIYIDDYTVYKTGESSKGDRHD